MKHLILLLLICISLGNSSIKAQTNLYTLNGTWKPVAQEMGGNVIQASSFEKQRLVLIDSAYTFTAESVDKGALWYKDGKMDIYGKVGVNSGKHFMAIYKFENGKLTICYNLKGDSYPVSFETKGDGLLFMSVFVRE